MGGPLALHGACLLPFVGPWAYSALFGVPAAVMGLALSSESEDLFLKARYSGTTGPWDLGAMGPVTRGPWDQANKRPWDRGTKGPRDQGTMGPWDLGTMEPWDQGTMGPWDP